MTDNEYDLLKLRHLAMNIESRGGDSFSSNPRLLKNHIQRLHASSAFSPSDHAQEARTIGLLYPLRGKLITPSELYFRFYEQSLLGTPYVYDGHRHAIVTVEKRKGANIEHFLLCKAMICKQDAPAKKSKHEVNYREGNASQNCNTCQFYQYAEKGCEKVFGYIDPLALCDLFRETNNGAKAMKLAKSIFGGSPSRLPDGEVWG